MTQGQPFLSRREAFFAVGSTNDVVRGWLAEGTQEVCIAVAEEQTDGRGRNGRVWLAPRGAALLLSAGFRPAYVAPDQLWRLAAIVSLAMIDAGEAVCGLRDGTLRLKWPNDIVAEAEDGTVRKLAGVLGETDAAGTDDVRATIGIGINGDWPRERFPADIADSMTSLSEVSGGRPFELSDLLEAFLLRLEPRLLALRTGRFDVAGWHDRQITTDRVIGLHLANGVIEIARAVGVDGVTGALLVEDNSMPTGEREVLTGEVVRVRLRSGGRASEPGDEPGDGPGDGPRDGPRDGPGDRGGPDQDPDDGSGAPADSGYTPPAGV